MSLSDLPPLPAPPDTKWLDRGLRVITVAIVVVFGAETVSAAIRSHWLVVFSDVMLLLVFGSVWLLRHMFIRAGEVRENGRMLSSAFEAEQRGLDLAQWRTHEITRMVAAFNERHGL